jgi:hypothetical protein
LETVNFSIIQGDAFNLVVTYTDENNQPINLTGFDVTFQVRDMPGGNVICTTATRGNGITIDNGAGKMTIHIIGDETDKFTVPKAAYQLKIDTTETTILSGWFAVDKAVIA